MTNFTVLDAQGISLCHEKLPVGVLPAGNFVLGHHPLGMKWNTETEEWSVPVPESITARQARLALHSLGKLSAVPAAIAALPEPQKTQAEIEWEYATHIERVNPFVDVLADALQLTDEQKAQLFIEGAKL